MLLDYWMYEVIKKALQEKIDKVSKRLTQEGFEKLKNNKFHDLGRLILSKKR